MWRLLLPLLFAAAPLTAQESVVTGMSTDNIALTANYNGSELFVFGAIRRDSPIVPDATPLDVIITLKGPERSVIVRRKERRFGIWINTEAVRVRNAPSLYAIASTAPLDGLLTATERLRHRIGMDQAVRLIEGNVSLEDTGSFTDAMVRLRKDQGLYIQEDGGVSLAEQTLFSARFEMPANLVEGDYATQFFLVRDREVISSGQGEIRVEKTGIERWFYNLSRDEPLAYGALAVALALAAGWLANTAFALAKR